MYLLYVDESGDCGCHNPNLPDRTGSKYFILSGVFVDVTKWKITLDTLKSFRKKIAREGFLPYDIEFHCAEMIDPHKVKAFSGISVKDRWMLMEEFAEVVGQQTSLKNISIVIDKTTSKLDPKEYLTSAVSALYLSFDEFLKEKKENGLVFFDRANERIVNTHVRTILGTGVSGTKTNIRIGWIIEDPIFRVSSDSMFIQVADLCAYTVKEMCFPIGARKKYHADRIFKKRISSSVHRTSTTDEDGIIRL